MNEEERIYPFIKNLYGGNGTCPDAESMAGSGIPETNRMAYGGAYSYPYAVCLGYSMIPNVQFSGIPFPYPSVVCGSSGHQIKTKIVRVDSEGKETEILFDSDKNSRPENRIGQKQETKKQPGKSTEEICKRFTEMLLFLIQENEIVVLQENEIAVSVGKDCDEKEWDICYGYEEAGYIYLDPQETHSFVAKRIRETDGAEGIPTSRQLQCYLYQVNILEKGDGKNYTKKKTIKKKRGRYWCLKKKEMSEFVRKHEEKDSDIIHDMKKLKI